MSSFSEGRLAKISPEMNDSGSLCDHLVFYRIKKFVLKKKLKLFDDTFFEISEIREVVPV